MPISGHWALYIAFASLRFPCEAGTVGGATAGAPMIVSGGASFPAPRRCPPGWDRAGTTDHRSSRCMSSQGELTGDGANWGFGSTLAATSDATPKNITPVATSEFLNCS